MLNGKLCDIVDGKGALLATLLPITVGGALAAKDPWHP
jgi:hypothetical protein